MPSPVESRRARPLAAVVDLGTNAARLAMASLDPSGRLVSQGRWRELIRLGEGLERSGRLSPQAMDRGVACLRRFAARIAERGVDALDAMATSALREAANREEFLARAREAGVPLRVIPPEEEARLALAGVLAVLERPPARVWAFDVGGGSLEVMRSEAGRLAQAVSLRAGVVYLTERHLAEVPTPAEQVEACAREVRSRLGAPPLPPPGGEEVPLIGCGGVVALAGFMGPEPGRAMNGRILSAGELGGWIPRFSALDWGSRRALPGFEPGREDIALAGLIVVREVLRWAGRPSFQVSTGGVREGRLLELLRGN